MVIHFKVAGHLACGHHGTNLPSSTELNRVKCRTCRNTDAFALVWYPATHPIIKRKQ